MKIPSIGGLLYHFRDLLDFKNPDHFLWQARGVIHVGANAGFEREDYHRKMLDVVWIEPIPSVFENLCANIRKYPRQKALQALITNCEGKSMILTSLVDRQYRPLFLTCLSIAFYGQM
jgi:hypothetical protein